MTNVTELYPKPTLLSRLAGLVAEEAIAARDGTTSERAELIMVLATIVGRALSIMTHGDTQAAQALVPLITETIASEIAEGGEMHRIADQLFGPDESHTPPAGGAA